MATESLRLMLVLGLPQSGGQRLRRCLELCGAPAIRDGDVDHWHAESLSAAGVDAHSIAPQPLRWHGSEGAAQMRAQLQDALKAALPQSGLRVLQLPGQERMLPLWQTCFAELAIQPHCVLVLRHPLEVADSLSRAMGCSRDRGLLIWLQSTLAMEAATRGHGRLVLEQERLNWDPDGVLDHLERHFNLALPERSHERLLLWEQEEQTDRQEQWRVESSVPLAAVEGSPLLQMALELHQWLQAEARGETRQRLMPDVICQQLAWAEALYGRTLAEEQQQRRQAEQRLAGLNRSRLVRLRRWWRRESAQAG